MEQVSRRDFLGTGVRLGGLIGLASLVNACSKDKSDQNYFPGTIRGRSIPTIKTVKISEITKDDIGSYVLARYEDRSQKNGNLVHSDDDKITIYSSRMDAMNALMEMREKSQEGIFDLIQVVDQNYSRYQREGTLNGLR